MQLRIKEQIRPCSWQINQERREGLTERGGGGYWISSPEKGGGAYLRGRNLIENLWYLELLIKDRLPWVTAPKCIDQLLIFYTHCSGYSVICECWKLPSFQIGFSNVFVFFHITNNVSLEKMFKNFSTMLLKLFGIWLLQTIISSKIVII